MFTAKHAQFGTIAIVKAQVTSFMPVSDTQTMICFQDYKIQVENSVSEVWVLMGGKTK